MTKKQHYMTRDERYQLEALLKAKVRVSRIARQLGFCRQTIYNEMKRGAYVHTCGYWDEVRYSADKAQQLHKYNQTAKGRPLKIGNDRAYAMFLEEKMLGVQADGRIDRRKRYSPAAALAEARKAGYQTSVCVSTLYGYITKRVFLHLTNKDLWEKGKKKKQGHKTVRRIAHPALPSIANRPEEINLREEKGHWEIDLVVGKEGKGPVLLTMVERSTKKPLLSKLPDGGRAGQRCSSSCRTSGRRVCGRYSTHWSGKWESGGSGSGSEPSPRTTGRSFWNMRSWWSPSTAGSGSRCTTATATPPGRRGATKT